MARYIDTDKIVNGLREAVERMRPNDNTKEIIDIFCEGLQNEPTADVTEIIHSRWENISGFDVCNICGTSPAYWEPEPNNPKGYPPYCHNCGAKMDEIK